MNDNPIRIGVTLENDTTQKFLAVKQHIGIKSHADIVRWLINNYYEKEKLEKVKPMLEHYNLNDNGVRVRDPSLATQNSPLGLIVDISFKPQGIRCDYCRTDNCRHIHFALTVPAIQEVIRKKRKDGWKLPDI